MMNEITHGQAKQYMLADLDGLLTSAQRLDLETHLRACETCRAESQSYSTLTARLQTELHARWDAQDGPSEQVLKNIHTQSRRIKMSKQVDFAFNLLGGLAAVLVVGFIAISLISQFQKTETISNGIQTNLPAYAPQPEERLIAFVSMGERGNGDIFTMKADGSDLTNLTNNPATDDSPAWSPDGTQIAFVSDRSGGRDIYVMNVDGSNVRKLTDSSTFNDHFTWSPDGTKIAYLSSLFDASQLMVMNADGSNKIMLTTEPGRYNILGWSPDGRKIVYQKWMEEWITNPTGRWEETRLLDAGIYVIDINGENRHGWSIHNLFYQIHWEDTEHFIGKNYVLDEEKLQWSLFRFDTNGNAPIELASHAIPIVAIFDGTYVVEGQDSLGWFAYSGAPIPTSPRDFSQTCNTRGFPMAQGTTHTVSPSKGQAFVTVHCDGTTGFYLENADGSQFVQLTDFSIGDIVNPLGDFNWSPDEKYVIVTIANRNRQDLYLFDIQEMLNDPSTQPIQLTTDGAPKYGAVWQPVSTNVFVEEEPTPETEKTSSSGGLLAFTMEQDGNSDIYTMHPDGSGLTNLTDHPALDRNPAWSPDGKRIAFESNRAAFTQIYLMDADGSNVTQLTFDEIEHEMTMNYANSNPWSPDGSHLLFFQRAYPEKGSTPVPLELYSMDVNSGNKVLLASGNITLFDVTWSPDGRHVAYIATNPQNPNASHIYVVDADGSNHRVVTKSLPAEESPGGYFSTRLYWARDGQSIFFIASNYNLPASWGSDNPLYWKVYESNLGGSLTLHATTRSPIGDWWDGVYFVTPFMGPGSWTWVYPDGTFNSINPTKDCKQERLYDPSGDSYTSATANFNQSPNGNGLIIASCPDGEVALSLVNSTGTEIMPLAKLSTAPEVGYLDRIQWSQDDRFVAFILASSNKTEMYIINIAESLKDPSIQPVKSDIVGEVQYYSFSWQPIP